MVSIRKLYDDDVETLYDIAIRSFQPDYEKYGLYPPLLNIKQKCFLPSIVFGKVILIEDMIIGGMFVFTSEEKGEIGSIFLDTPYQHKGYGKEIMLKIEQLYPKAKSWKLETPSKNYNLHRFYEFLGYIKIGEMTDKNSGMTCFIYEKTME